jgi:hypothetical protein
MDPVGKLSRALALMRRAVGTGRQASGASAGRPDAGLATAGQQDVAHAVVRRLREIPPDDPEWRTLALRVFLEQVLLEEFGPGLKNSPRFQEMVGEVQRMMDGDPGLHAELDVLIETLTAQR